MARAHCFESLKSLVIEPQSAAAALHASAWISPQTTGVSSRRQAGQTIPLAFNPLSLPSFGVIPLGNRL